MKQQAELTVYKMHCDNCDQPFYEIETLACCPRCAADIPDDNIGEQTEEIVELDTLTGRITPVEKA
jgi:predicted amidophosphoribosyltransferase